MGPFWCKSSRRVENLNICRSLYHTCKYNFKSVVNCVWKQTASPRTIVSYTLGSVVTLISNEVLIASPIRVIAKRPHRLLNYNADITDNAA